ncbi:MAG: sensor histidine kinase [Acidobacteria bacterium]|nr:sensor histidine kinase [Acidobacteriota bacterium]
MTATRLPGAETLFRAAGILATAALGLVAVESLEAPKELPYGFADFALVVTKAVVAVLVVVFGWTFLALTRRGPRARVDKQTVVLAVSLSALGLFLSTDLLFVVAAGLAYALPRRAAYALFAVQVLGTLVVCALLLWSGDFVSTPELDHSSRPVQVALTVLVVLTFQLFAFSAGSVAADERLKREELARRTAELAATQDLLASSVRMAERLALSRELHDTVGHHLTVLSVQLEIAKKTSEGRALEAATQAQRVVRLLLADVRETVSGLREAEAVDLESALTRLREGLPGLEVSLSVSARELPPETAHALFRVVQEALTNVCRHAEARHVSVAVAGEAGNVRLSVRDDGRGAAAYSPGNGLNGLAERVRALGGSFSAGPLAPRGFRVEATLPLATAGAA